MDDLPEISTINSYKSAGLVLVLFILLVIVNGIFFNVSNRANASDELNDTFIAASLVFEISNQTYSYTLRRTSFVGDTGTPVPSATIAPTRASRLPVKKELFRMTSATATYDALNQNNAKVGGFQCTMFISDNGDAYFTGVTKTGSINTTVTFSGETPVLVIRSS
ncbi:hypothetical protein [Paenibacillus herberti]|uniref:Uncharacterized protein n=1 Tax=Paenibacillus herberti TaxID=1619309 RepID=A0A229P1V8_9BACL|nr:hypothetical protein [Paenibacillus herberti]OXM15944.1 hypothetical protein CGZ75_04345 [Paenibacillus herberti]